MLQHVACSPSVAVQPRLRFYGPKETAETIGLDWSRRQLPHLRSRPLPALPSSGACLEGATKDVTSQMGTYRPATSVVFQYICLRDGS